MDAGSVSLPWELLASGGFRAARSYQGRRHARRALMGGEKSGPHPHLTVELCLLCHFLHLHITSHTSVKPQAQILEYLYLLHFLSINPPTTSPTGCSNHHCLTFHCIERKPPLQHILPLYPAFSGAHQVTLPTKQYHLCTAKVHTILPLL